jgi:hypothetical protein
MENRDDGGPAFPMPGHESKGYEYATQDGMSLRDWFAGQALARLADIEHVGKDGDFSACGEFAYRFADAMLAARKAAR